MVQARTTVWLRPETRELIRKNKQPREKTDQTIRRVFLKHEAAERGEDVGYISADVLAVVPPKRRTMNPKQYRILLQLGKIHYLYTRGDFKEIKDLKQARRDLEKWFKC